MVFVLTPDFVLRRGLELVGYNLYRQQKVQAATNLKRFEAYYGPSPLVYALVWEELQTTQIAAARIPHAKIKEFEMFLLAIYFLRCYPTENQWAGQFQVCDKTARKWVWFYAEKIQALKSSKIAWPERWNNDVNSETFIMSVGGTHCRLNEPKHPTMCKNHAYQSHKLNDTALDYELGISLFENKLVWMNGPFPAAMHDITIFREKGLMAKIPAGKRVIGDSGYKGERGVISTRSSCDPEELQKLVLRARRRHQEFIRRLKCFKCLDGKFRHGIPKHKIVFEAACVIVQYQMENGSPLIDV